MTASRNRRRLASTQRQDARLRLRQGVVDALNADGTVDVTVGGDSVVVGDVAVLGWAAAGGGVWLLQHGTDLLALGATGGAMPIGAVNSGTAITDFPVGVTVKGTGGSGWGEETPGVLETIRVPPATGGGSWGRQVWSCMAHNPVDVYARRWIVNSSSWSSWVAL